MANQTPCPRCRHANPPDNRFCGWCGASLGAGSDLVARRESNLTVMGHVLPVKPGPVGKAVAVGLVTLAARAGISWLRYRTTTGNRSSALSTREPDTAVSARLLGQRLEEVLIQELEEDYRSRTIAWRALRSIVVTEWTSSSRRSAGRPRGMRSSGSSRASSPPFEPER
jgi:Double zinc ribbon